MENKLITDLKNGIIGDPKEGLRLVQTDYSKTEKIFWELYGYAIDPEKFWTDIDIHKRTNVFIQRKMIREETYQWYMYEHPEINTPFLNHIRNQLHIKNPNTSIYIESTEEGIRINFEMAEKKPDILDKDVDDYIWGIE